MVKFTNKHGLPDPFFRYKRFKPYSKGDADISVTGLIKPPMERVLEEEYNDEIEIDVVDQMWALYGTAVHEVLATGSGMQEISEEDITVEIDGWKIKGGIDLQRTTRGGYLIEDYKVTTVFAYQKALRDFDAHNWVKQINCYAQMVRMAKRIPVSGGKIWTILRDWSKTRAKNDNTNMYPQSPMQALFAPMWSEEEALAYIRERIALHQKADNLRVAGHYPSICTPEERWEQPTTYAAYRKKENKRPSKVFDSLNEAQGYLDNTGATGIGFVEERVGENVKCVSFCNVRNWCPFGRMLED